MMNNTNLIINFLTIQLFKKHIRTLKPSSMVIFTDGSVTKKFEKAGAAALLQYKGEYFDSVAKVNSSASSTEAELIAVLLALHKCNNLQLAQADFDHLIIYTDSDSLLTLLEKKEPTDHIELLGAIKLEANAVRKTIVI